MDLTLNNKTKVLPPVSAALYDGSNPYKPSRYNWLSLDLAEPNLGIPYSTGTYYLTSDIYGSRGWTNKLALDDIVASTIIALTATFNHLTVRERLCSYGYTNVFDVSSIYPAVKITQKGTGLALSVEDTADIKFLNSDTIVTKNLSALSAFFEVIDIKIYELSGFNITGDVNIDGNLTVTKSITGNSLFVNKLDVVGDSTFNGNISGNNLRVSFNQGTSTGLYSFTNGYRTSATSYYSNAEGSFTLASNSNSHAEGHYSVASGDTSHAEGGSTTASGSYSHAEGYDAQALGSYSHAEGNNTEASGSGSHAEGSNTKAIGNSSHAEGYNTSSNGQQSHAEGLNTNAAGNTSHAEGDNTLANAVASHAEGSYTKAFGVASHAESYFTTASGDYSHAEGNSSIAIGESSHAEGMASIASGVASHAEGDRTQAINRSSHAEGTTTIASGSASHAEGINTIALGDFSHVEGSETATGERVEFYYNTPSVSERNVYSFAPSTSSKFTSLTAGDVVLGFDYLALSGKYFNFIVLDRSTTTGVITATLASDVLYNLSGSGYLFTKAGNYSHAEGRFSNAVGDFSHAAGYNATANNNYSFIWTDGNLGTRNLPLVNNIKTTRDGQFLVSASGGFFIPGNVGIKTDQNNISLTVLGETYLERLTADLIYNTNLRTVNINTTTLSSINGAFTNGTINTLSSFNIFSYGVYTDYLNASSFNTPQLNLESLTSKYIYSNYLSSGEIAAVNIVTENLSTINLYSKYNIFDSLTADSIITNSLTALSATFKVVDISIYEISGFRVTGDFQIDGNLTVSKDISATNAINFGTAKGTSIFVDTYYSNYIYVTYLSAVSANINSLNIEKEVISDSIYTRFLQASSVKLPELNVDSITANTMVVDYLSATKLTSDTANLSTLYFQSATGVNLIVNNLSAKNFQNLLDLISNTITTSSINASTATFSSTNTNLFNANLITLSSFTITGEVKTSTQTITATDQFLKVLVNGVDKYIRLFEL